MGTEIYEKCHEAMREQRTVRYETYFPPTDAWHEVDIHPSREGLSLYSRDVTERKRSEEQLSYYAALKEDMQDAFIATDERGETTGYLAINRDITEGKRFETEQQRLVDIVQRSSDSIGISDLEGCAIFVNEAGQKLVGLNGIEEVRSTTVPDYLMPEDRAFVWDVLFPTVLEQGRYEEEFTFRHFKTGEPIPVLWDVFRLDDPQTGEPIGLATVTRDLIEAKQAEERLEAAREEERSRIARDLHDEALQDLAGAMAQAQLARRATSGIPGSPSGWNGSPRPLSASSNGCAAPSKAIPVFVGD